MDKESSIIIKIRVFLKGSGLKEKHFKKVFWFGRMAESMKVNIGNYVNNVRDGYGEYYYADGKIYKGMWKGGLMHG